MTWGHAKSAGSPRRLDLALPALSVSARNIGEHTPAQTTAPKSKPRGASILTPDRLRLRGAMQGNRSREAMDRYVATHQALMGKGG